jgi:hypothetical protein
MKDQFIKKTTGMSAHSISELNATYERLGIILRRQMGKEVISKNGPWASVAFKFQNSDGEGGFDPSRVMLASFKSMDGMYRRFSYFNIKNKEEAEKICSFLKECFDL